MFQTKEAQLGARADQLMSGRMDELVQHYRYPLPLHMVRTRIILRDAGEARAVFGLLRQSLVDRGVIALIPRVAAVDLPSARRRFRLWVDWQERTRTGEGCRHSSAIYYCAATPSGFQTEMIQYTRQSMPELTPHFAALALSA